MKKFKFVLIIFIISYCLLVGIQNGFAQNYGLGNIPIDPNTYNQHLKTVPKNLLSHSLSSSYDARNHDIVTPAKSQGSCGSCWSFASVGALESHLLKNEFLFYPEDLSEQQLLSCNQYNYDCDGGSSDAINYWASNGPIYDNCFSYNGEETLCYPSYSCTELGYRIYDWHTVPNSIYNYKYSLYYYGPSYWYFDVYEDFYDFWNFYSPGKVYVNNNGSYLGSHAVLLIGWDDTQEYIDGNNNVGYGAFLCKNSWGTGGPNGDGTFWIAYTKHLNDLRFGMTNFRVKSIGCASDSECDDRLYCNGTETCVGGSCKDNLEPCYDDGEFCNGTNTCDEENDRCINIGNPCTDYYSVCNETTDQCDDVECFDDDDCSDGESLTIDTCHNNGTAYSYCENVLEHVPKRHKKEFWEEYGCFLTIF